MILISQFRGLFLKKKKPTNKPTVNYQNAPILPGHRKATGIDFAIFASSIHQQLRHLSRIPCPLDSICLIGLRAIG